MKKQLSEDFTWTPRGYETELLSEKRWFEYYVDPTAFGIEVRGTEMQPYMAPEDFIIVWPMANLMDGGFYLVRLIPEDIATIKLVHFQNKEIPSEDADIYTLSSSPFPSTRTRKPGTYKLLGRILGMKRNLVCGNYWI